MTQGQQDGIHGHLEAEREPAARRYVAALGALDAAAEASPLVASTAAAAAADAARLNDVWNKYGTKPGDSGAMGIVKRVAVELGRLLPWRRRRLHGAMIAAINRNTDATRALIDATHHFQAHVVWYAQSVAAIASTGRSDAGTPEGIEALQRALWAISADWLKRWEGLAAREQRFDARMAALTKAYNDVVEIASQAQQNTIALRRAVENLSSAGQPAGASAVPAHPAAPFDAAALKYLIFEDRYRDSREEIGRRLAEYLPLFDGTTNVLDIGCGRGELLGLLRARGITARGVDTNEEMVEACRAAGLTADFSDALSFLQTQPDRSLGGLIAIQVVEHLEASYLMRLIDTAFHKLRPGAPIVLETVNTACWAAFFDSYIRDFTHAHPLHPETLKYLVQSSGFSVADVRYLSPIDEHHKLPFVKVINERDANPTIIEMVEALNTFATRLNSQLFTYRDYAIIARR
jgi:predicted TPR repeat methyltransferase